MTQLSPRAAVAQLDSASAGKAQRKVNSLKLLKPRGSNFLFSKVNMHNYLVDGIAIMTGPAQVL